MTGVATFGVWSLVPALVTIVVAVATHRVVLALFLGIVAGAFTLAGGAFWAGGSRSLGYLVLSFADRERLEIALFILLVGGLLEVVARSGAYERFAAAIAGWLNSPRRARVATFLLSLCVFFDDYANVLVCGASMRTMGRVHRLSPALLAYLTDQTATIVSVVLLSTWAGFEASLLAGAAEPLGVKAGSSALFLAAVPYHVMTFLGLLLAGVTAWTGRWIGARLDDGGGIAAPGKAQEGSVIQATPVDAARDPASASIGASVPGMAPGGTTAAPDGIGEPQGTDRVGRGMERSAVTASPEELAGTARRSGTARPGEGNPTDRMSEGLPRCRHGWRRETPVSRIATGPTDTRLEGLPLCPAGGREPPDSRTAEGSSRGGGRDPARAVAGLRHMLVPLGGLVAVAVAGLVGFAVRNAFASWGEGLTIVSVCSDLPTVRILLAAAVIALAAGLWLVRRDGLLTWREIGAGLGKGAWSMVATSLVILLAKGLAAVSTDLGTGPWLTSLLGERLSPPAVPVATLLVSFAITVATGFSWSSMAIVMPIGFQMAMATGGEAFLPLVAGAVISGSIAGGLMIPYSDTTVITAAGFGIHPVYHAKTQALQILTLVPAAVLSLWMLGAGWGFAAAYGLPALLLIGTHALLARPGARLPGGETGGSS